MKHRMRLLPPLLLGLFTCLGGGCSDADLQPELGPPPGVVDNLLEVTGSLCTETPEDTVFPVKILLIIDTSGSMQCTDESFMRSTATLELVNRFSGRPGMEMGLIRFNESIDVSDSDGDGIANFVTNPAVNPAFTGVMSRLMNADGPTNYQGALTAAFQAVLWDIVDTTNAGLNQEVPRTKYVLIFFSDGAPDPRCSATMPDIYLFCETARMDWADIGLNPNDPNLWFSYTDGDDFNQDYQILNLVQDIMGLEPQFGVGEIRFHTAYLHPPMYQGPVCSGSNWDMVFGVDPTLAINLLTQMSTIGNGTFTDYYMAQGITFLDYDYTSIEVPFSLVNLIAYNMNALPNVDTFIPDSDGDGIDDDTEFEYDPIAGDMMDPRLVTDFDGDGWPDLFEHRNLERGFDPADPALPFANCANTYVTGLGDNDSDGLLDCEEFLIGSEIGIADSDRDRFLDFIEFRAGLDLTAVDLTGDIDNDGIFNADEMLFHTNPLTQDIEIIETGRYWYELEELPREADGTTCYDFTVRNITLVTTLETPSALAGTNDVYFYATQAPQGDSLDYGDIMVACVRVRYVAPDFKDPADGVMDLAELDWIDLEDFDPDLHCVLP